MFESDHLNAVDDFSDTHDGKMVGSSRDGVRACGDSERLATNGSLAVDSRASKTATPATDRLVPNHKNKNLSF